MRFQRTVHLFGSAHSVLTISPFNYRLKTNPQCTNFTSSILPAKTLSLKQAPGFCDARSLSCLFQWRVQWDQLYPVHTLIPSLSENNLSTQSTSIIHFRLPNQNFACMSKFVHTFYTSDPYQASWFHHLNLSLPQDYSHFVTNPQQSPILIFGKRQSGFITSVLLNIITAIRGLIR